MAVASLTDEDIKMIQSLARDEKIGERVSLCNSYQSILYFLGLC